MSLIMISSVLISIMSSNIVDSADSSIDTKIEALYNGLLNGAGDTNKLEKWMDNFSDQIKYCWVDDKSVYECVKTKNAFKPIIQDKYFDTNNLITQNCLITHEDKYGLAADIDCEYTFKSTTTNKCTMQYTEEHIDYDANGELILQYYLTSASAATMVECPRKSADSSIDSKITALYNELVNGAGDTNKLDKWMNNFAGTMKYCEMASSPKCSNRDEFKQIISDKYFSTNNLIIEDCNISKSYKDNLEADIKCKYTFESTDTKQCTTQSTTEHIDYDANGELILQYYVLTSSGLQSITCPVY